MSRDKRSLIRQFESLNTGDKYHRSDIVGILFWKTIFSLTVHCAVLCALSCSVLYNVQSCVICTAVYCALYSTVGSVLQCTVHCAVLCALYCSVLCTVQYCVLCTACVMLASYSVNFTELSRHFIELQFQSMNALYYTYLLYFIW